MSSTSTSDKQDLIRKAAISVFSRRGYHDSKMEDVAQEAGVGKGTVYLYFPGKQALLEDIFRYTIGLYVEAVDDIRDEGCSLRQQLEGIVGHVLGMVSGNQQAAGFLLEGATGMSNEFKAWVIGVKRLLMDRFVAMLKDAEENGEIHKVDGEVWAHLITGGINSLITTILWGNGPLTTEDHRKLAKRVVEEWWTGLKGIERREEGAPRGDEKGR